MSNKGAIRAAHAVCVVLVAGLSVTVFYMGLTFADPYVGCSEPPVVEPGGVVPLVVDGKRVGTVRGEPQAILVSLYLKPAPGDLVYYGGKMWVVRRVSDRISLSKLGLPLGYYVELEVPPARRN